MNSFEQQREDATRADARDAALRRFTLKYDECVSGQEREAFKQGFTAGQLSAIALESAAPDLLAACKLYIWSVHEADPQFNVVAVHDAIEAAIAKATPNGKDVTP